MKKLILILGLSALTIAQVGNPYGAGNSNGTGSSITNSSGGYAGEAKQSNRSYDSGNGSFNADGAAKPIPQGNPTSINSITNGGSTDVNNSYVRGAKNKE